MTELNHDQAERPKVAEHYCKTTLKSAKTSMEWAVEDFSLLRMDSSHCLESSSFESVSEEGVHTGTWKMKLVPNLATKGTIGLFFSFSGDVANTFAEFEACLIGEDGTEVNKMELACELLHSDIVFEEFIKKNSLVDSLLTDGYLTIRGNIRVIRMTLTETKSGELDGGTSLNQDLEKLMKEATLKDAVLICGGRKFPIHKCILSARSSVFSAMFTGEWKEKDCVEIKDMEADVFENLLSYIYTDDVLDDFTTVDMAIKLAEAADRYNLLELKDICEEYMEKNISMHNLLEVAAVADRHSLNLMKAACITFMCEHGKEIIDSDNFKDFRTTAPQFLLEGVLKQQFGAQSSPNGQVTSSFPQTSPTFTTQVTSCHSCNPSLHTNSCCGAFPVIPDRPRGFGLPVAGLQFPTFNFGQVPK